MNRRTIPKLCGGDIELANFFTGVDSPPGTGNRAALALLRQIDGIAGRSRMSAVAYDRACSNGYRTGESQFDPQDWMRTYLPGNGGCAYIETGSYFEV